MGSDGCLYFSRHRGSPAAAHDANHYEGDWIFRCNPKPGAPAALRRVPGPKPSWPHRVRDRDRWIFYGATAAGPHAAQQGIWFFAYDLKNNKPLFSGPDGPSRYMMFARSTGNVYYVPGSRDGQPMRFEPAVGKPVPV